MLGDTLSASGLGLDHDWGFYLPLSLLLAGLAAIPIAAGVMLRMLTRPRPSLERLAVPAATAALAVVVLASTYSQARARLSIDTGSERPLLVDEAAGTIGGVGVGDGPARIREAFGRSDAVGIDPNEIRADHPSRQTGPPWLPGELDYHRYPGLTFLVKRDRRIWGVISTRGETESSRGVGVGDSLRLVRERYPGLRCEREYSHNDGATGDPFCWGQIPGGAVLHFGGNPINTIVIRRGRNGP